MDPNATLKEILHLAVAVAEADTFSEVCIADAQRLAELVIDLDHWISKGGFLPDLWGKP